MHTQLPAGGEAQNSKIKRRDPVKQGYPHDYKRAYGRGEGQQASRRPQGASLGASLFLPVTPKYSLVIRVPFLSFWVLC